MSVESNKAQSLAWYEALNSPNWEQAVEPLFVGVFAQYHDWFMESHRLFRRAFPDYHATIVHAVAEGDTVILLLKVTGTHSAEYPEGELKGIAPTGKKLEWYEASVTVYQDGVPTDIQLIIDGVTRLQQLGVLPVEQGM